MPIVHGAASQIGLVFFIEIHLSYIELNKKFSDYHNDFKNYRNISKNIVLYRYNKEYYGLI